MMQCQVEVGCWVAEKKLLDKFVKLSKMVKKTFYGIVYFLPSFIACVFSDLLQVCQLQKNEFYRLLKKSFIKY